MDDIIYVHSNGRSYDPESDGPFVVYIVSELTVTPDAKSHALAATTHVDVRRYPCLIGSREHATPHVTFRVAASLLVRATKRISVFRVYVVNGDDQVLVDWLGGIMFAPAWLGQYLNALESTRKRGN